MSQSDFNFYPEQISAIERRLTTCMRLGPQSDSGFYNLEHELKSDISKLRSILQQDAQKSSDPELYVDMLDWITNLESTRLDTYLRFAKERRWL